MQYTKALPVRCPSCAGSLRVTRFHCEACDTTVSGAFDLPPLALLAREERDFVLRFVLASGSLKQMASTYGVSYPTVRNRLNDVIDRLQEIENEPSSPD